MEQQPASDKAAEESKEPKPSAAKPEPDYTTQAELNSFQKSVQMEDPYIQVMNI